MGRVWGRLLVVGLLGLFLVGGPGGQKAPAQPEKSSGGGLEKLLKDSGLDHRKVKDGVYRVVIERGGDLSAVVMEEKKFGTRGNGEAVMYGYIYTEILQMPAEFKVPGAMLLRLAELNDRVRFGSIGLSKNQDGTLSVFWNSCCFLRTADGLELRDLAGIAHDARSDLRKELRGFVEEGK